MIEDNLVEAVIGLPPNLFFGTGIPAAILLLNKGKTTTDILFVDASQGFEDGTNMNRLRDQDVDDIVGVHRAFASKAKYAYRAFVKEVADDNEFNLNISRYVETFEPEPEVNLKAVREEIASLEEQIASTRKDIQAHLMELGIDG
jgi:type I restriction enzyme M protein